MYGRYCPQGKSDSSDGEQVNMKSYYSFLVMFSCVFCGLDAGPITFGDANSALKIASGAKLLIKTTLQNDGGTINKAAGGIIEGDSAASRLEFLDGFYTTTNRTVLLDGDFDPDGAQAIELAGDQTLRADAGANLEALAISGTGNRIEGQPSFAGDIVLLDASTDLTVAIQSKLDTNVTLNSGVVTLANDISLGDGSQFIGSGIINLNGNRLAYGSSDLAMTSSILWDSAADITLNGRMELSGTWTFSGTSTLNGNGNILDLGDTGKIWVQGGSTLNVTDIKIKGIQFPCTDTDIIGSFVMEDINSQINLSHARLEFDTAFTFSIGNTFVEGSTTFVTRDNLVTFDTASLLTVDGTTLWVDPLDVTSGVNGISPISDIDSHLTFLNNGRIEEVGGGVLLRANSDAIHANSQAIVAHSGHLINLDERLVATTDAVYANSWAIDYLANQTGGTPSSQGNLYFSTNTTLTFDYSLSTESQMYFEGNVVLDGAGHEIHLSRNIVGAFNLDPGVTVTLQDVVLLGLKPSHVTLGAGSHLLFGDGVFAQIEEDVDLSLTWTFGGTVTLEGNGREIALDATGLIYITDGGTLKLQDMTITGVQDNRIRCQNNATSFIFEDLIMQLSSDFSFTTGSFEVKRYFDVQGISQFNYQTAMGSTIDAISEWNICRNVTFRYDPSAAYRNLIVMTDQTSIFDFNAATLSISTTGLQLTKGTFRIENQCYLDSDATHPEEAFILGDTIGANDVIVEIDAAANLKILNGIVVYKNALG